MSDFIGRKSQIEKFKKLLKAGKGQLWVIEGEGGLGKTTLLRRLEEIAKQEKQPHLFIGIDDLQPFKTGAEFLLNLVAQDLPAYKLAVDKAEGIYRSVQAQMKDFMPELKEATGYLKDVYAVEEHEKQMAAVVDKYMSSFLHTVGKVFSKEEEHEKKRIAENIESFLMSSLLENCKQHPVIFVDTYEHLYVKEELAKQSIASQLNEHFQPFSRKTDAIKTYGLSIWLNKWLQLLVDKGAIVVIAGRHFELWRTQLEQLDKFSEVEIRQLVEASHYPKIKLLSTQAAASEALLSVLKRVSFGGNPLWLAVGMNLVELLLQEGKDILDLAKNEHALQECFEHTEGTLNPEEIEHASCKLAIFNRVTRQLPAHLLDQIWKLALPNVLDEEILSILLGDNIESVIPLYKNLRILNKKRGDKSFYLHEEVRDLLTFYARNKKYWDSEMAHSLHDKLANLFEVRAKRKQALLPNLIVEWMDLALATEMYYHQHHGKIINLEELMGVSYFLASSCSDIIDNPTLEDNWFMMGLVLFASGCNEEAIASYDKALELKHNFHKAWNNRGAALSDLGRKEEAIASYDKALELKPDFHKAWNNRGVVLSNVGRKKEAIVSYDKALEFKPDFHEAWNNRGLALSYLGRKEEAIASYDKAIELKPDDNEAWFNRGNSLSDLGRQEEAIASYDKAIELKPDSHNTWNNRGLALSDLGRKEEAIASYDKAIALSDLGRKEEAIISYGKAIAIKPDHDLAWLMRGRALIRSGRYEEGFSNAQKALELKPEIYSKVLSPRAYRWMKKLEKFGDALDKLLSRFRKS
jgi:tetratricopeptide (TPR) repeat protein